LPLTFFSWHEQVKELLKAFGEVTQFNLLRDAEGNSKGTAVFEFKDAEMAALAIKGLNSLTLAGSKLSAQVSFAPR